jgi:hypothetical protein
VVQEANVDGPAVPLFPLGSDWDRALEYGGLKSNRHADMHAGEIETSILLHAAPELVRDGYEDADHDSDQRPFLLVHGMAEYTDSGVIGFPSLATAEKGKALLESLRSSLAPPRRTQLSELSCAGGTHDDGPSTCMERFREARLLCPARRSARGHKSVQPPTIEHLANPANN